MTMRSAKRLQRDPVRLAILALVQVTNLRRLMMSTPKCLAVARPPSGAFLHLDFSRLQIARREQIGIPISATRVRSLDAYRAWRTFPLRPEAIPHSLQGQG